MQTPKDGGETNGHENQPPQPHEGEVHRHAAGDLRARDLHDAHDEDNPEEP